MLGFLFFFLYYSRLFPIIVLFSLYTSCYGYILRTPCQTEADFSVIKSGEIISGAVIETLANKLVMECEYDCVNNSACKSINYNSETKLCQLNSKIIGESGTNKSSTSGWIYKTTNYQTWLVRHHTYRFYLVLFMNNKHEMISLIDFVFCHSLRHFMDGNCFNLILPGGGAKYAPSSFSYILKHLKLSS